MATISAPAASDMALNCRPSATRELNMTKFYYYSCTPDESRRRANVNYSGQPAGIAPCKQQNPISKYQFNQQSSKQAGNQISNSRSKKPSLTSDNLSLNDSTTSSGTTSNDNDPPHCDHNARSAAAAAATFDDCYRQKSAHMNVKSHISSRQQEDKFVRVGGRIEHEFVPPCAALIKPEECTTTDLHSNYHMATHSASVATSGTTKPTIEEQLKRLFSNEPTQQQRPSQQTCDPRTSQPGYRGVNEPTVRYNNHHHLPTDHRVGRQTGFCIHHHDNLLKSNDRGQFVSLRPRPNDTTRNCIERKLSPSDEMTMFLAAARRTANLNNTQADKEARILKWLHDCHQATMQTTRHSHDSVPRFV